ncbi:PREDICTED: uncharacterized protein LOC108766507 isoform X1 [Trachymyrmex cornetzi]|uniref:uncharacterized protein LOC108766507 isoform X1 n=1 Tax=Trachymyrmex cornetzi TaxID=471704 RepID=UPI00084F6DBD|nr:PREDICTED: uncharacterized protein LOC108766507 isoform X1 [Trachymyrmex cornetzi]
MCRKKVRSDRKFDNVDYTQLTETDNDFFDSQFVSPPIEIPWKAIILAVLLFIGGTIMLIMGSLIVSGYIDSKIAAYMAAGIFNEGYLSILMTMQLLDLRIGQQCKLFADTTDESRIERQNARQSLSSKEARTARRAEQIHLHEYYEEAEGLLYGAGIAD